MGDPSMEKNVSGQLPKKILFPNQNGDKSKGEADTVAHNHLEEEDNTHDDHQFFNDRCQTISKRIAVIGHFSPSSLNPPNPPLVKGGEGRLKWILYFFILYRSTLSLMPRFSAALV
jgi:hypothetical protein